jgi:hypothetical protein
VYQFCDLLRFKLIISCQKRKKFSDDFFQNDVCRYNPKSSGASDVGFTDIAEGSEDQLKEAVATIGPISVAIDASHESFQFYKGGEYVVRRRDE